MPVVLDENLEIGIDINTTAISKSSSRPAYLSRAFKIFKISFIFIGVCCSYFEFYAKLRATKLPVVLNHDLGLINNELVKINLISVFGRYWATRLFVA
jgi:hypothetical protein